MRKYLVLCFILFTCSSLLAQRNLFKQKYLTIAEDFQIENSQLKDYRSQGKIEVFNENKHKTNLAKKLLKANSGQTKTFKSDYYQTEYLIISAQEIPHYRLRYIFIDKDKFETADAFESYAKKVRQLLKETTFKSVAMQYSMDYRKNFGGDTGWFKQGITHPIFFENATNSSKLIEEIFEFEIPQLNGYYFAQKLWTPKNIKEVLVLYTIEKK